MIVVALVGLISLGISSLIVQMTKNFKRAELRESVNLDHLEFETLLMSRAACANTFSRPAIGSLTNANSTPINVPNIIDGNNPGVVRIQPGLTTGIAADYFPRPPSPLAAAQYRLTGIVIESFTLTNSNPPPLRAGTFRVRFYYNFTNPGAPLNQAVRVNNFNATLSATDQVISCNNDKSSDYDLLYINVTGNETKDGNLDIVGNLQVTGPAPAAGYVYAQQFFVTSDERKKQNIQTLQDPLEKIRRINGVEFNWRDSEARDWGVIAQDVEKVAPFLVRTDPLSNYKTVNYNSLIALSIEAVKELDSKNKALEAELKKIELETSEIIREACQRDGNFRFCRPSK